MALNELQYTKTCSKNRNPQNWRPRIERKTNLARIAPKQANATVTGAARAREARWTKQIAKHYSPQTGGAVNDPGEPPATTTRAVNGTSGTIGGNYLLDNSR